MAAMFACKLPLSVHVHSSVNSQAEAGLSVCGAECLLGCVYARAHILLTSPPRRVAKAGTVCAFRELCVLAEGNCSNHTQIKTSQYREQGYLNTATEGGRGLEEEARCTQAGTLTHRSGSYCCANTRFYRDALTEG